MGPDQGPFPLIDRPEGVWGSDFVAEKEPDRADSKTLFPLKKALRTDPRTGPDSSGLIFCPHQLVRRTIV